MNRAWQTAEELACIGRDFELAEITYEDSEVALELTFEAPRSESAAHLNPLALAQLANLGTLGTPGVSSDSPAASSAPVTPKAQGETINSPLAGVFYRAPRPDSEPFVEVGTQVSVGQTLCIVEAMKLMNELTADRPCQILEILVNNAEAVEEGQPLFVISL